LFTDNVKLCTLKLALTVRAAFMLTVHVVPETESQPLHAPKTDPVFAAALNVTVVPVV